MNGTTRDRKEFRPEDPYTAHSAFQRVLKCIVQCMSISDLPAGGRVWMAPCATGGVMARRTLHVTHCLQPSLKCMPDYLDLLCHIRSGVTEPTSQRATPRRLSHQPPAQ